MFGTLFPQLIFCWLILGSSDSLLSVGLDWLCHVHSNHDEQIYINTLEKEVYGCTKHANYAWYDLIEFLFRQISFLSHRRQSRQQTFAVTISILKRSIEFCQKESDIKVSKSIKLLDKQNHPSQINYKPNGMNVYFSSSSSFFGLVAAWNYAESYNFRYILFYYEITSLDISNAHSLLAVVGLQQIYMNSPTLNLDEVIEYEAATECQYRETQIMCFVYNRTQP